MNHKPERAGFTHPEIWGVSWHPLGNIPTTWYLARATVLPARIGLLAATR
ncbi:hypothetical protein JKG47_09450 [Acidithiobacillus sp. MC6.1]|nr:hypothetical protein [Acidithiobacillus sp. MC6.1]